MSELLDSPLHTGAAATYDEVDPTTLHDMKTTLTAAAALIGALTGLSIPAAAFASTPATPAGVIHVYVTDSSTQGNDHKILITGAFSDHGTGNQATFYLTKGWIFSTSLGFRRSSTARASAPSTPLAARSGAAPRLPYPSSRAPAPTRASRAPSRGP